MTPPTDPPHRIVLTTLQDSPPLEGKMRTLALQGIKNLPARYPGLRVTSPEVFPDRVEMTLDLQRLDGDLDRIVQSFKAEVRTLAKKAGAGEKGLWKWGYEEKGMGA